jgi:hypothetical protein
MKDNKLKSSTINIKESTEMRTKRGRTVEGVPTCLSLFSGGGGLDLGFEMAGYRVLAATDIEPAAEKTFSRNWPLNIESNWWTTT